MGPREETLRWGILGVSGHVTRRMLGPWRRARLSKLYAIASRDKNAAAALAAKHDIPKSYGSYDELLADPDVQAVYIPLPNHLHLEWICKCAKAGKHVLCEKPLCLNIEEVQQAQSCCEEHGVQLMEAFMYKFHPRWQYAYELIHSGEIGSLRAIHTNFFYHNDDANNIRNKYINGGGALYDIGCYGISSVRYLIAAEPKRALCMIERSSSLGVDTLCSACLDFEGVQALFTVGTMTFPHQHIRVFGSGGSISMDIPFNTYNDTIQTLSISTALGKREVSFAAVDHYLLEIEAFSDSILQDNPVPIESADARNNMAVIDALFASEKTQGWEVVNSYA